MTRLAWNAVGERFFEAGTDRGVLFVDSQVGVPWNGLVSVSESPSGGEITPLYIDGVKYYNQAASEEFEATIEAYTYPDEFSACIGSFDVGNGLSVTQQKKRPFSLSYRTLIGNDVDGVDLGYKIHLVYQAMTTPTETNIGSIGDTVSPDNFSWKIVTKPSIVSGYKETSHFVISSIDTPSDILAQIEDILYGTVTTPSRLPSIDELLFIFSTTSDEEGSFDAGIPGEAIFATYDAGRVTDPVGPDFIDGGTP